MVINFELIIVYNQDAKIDENYDIRDVLETMPDVQIYDVTEINPIKADIMEKLLFACDENNSEVILVIGNIGSVEKHFVAEAIENVSDSKGLPEVVATYTLNIETTLNDIMPLKTVCGIRNQTLIIDLSGPHKNVKECLKAIKDMILQVVHSIHTDEEDKENVCDNSAKQKEAKITIKRRKKSTSPLALSPNASTIKRHKELFPMVLLSDALLKIHEIINTNNTNKIAFERVQVNNAYGRILGEKVEATYDLPPYKTSAKHGYAVLVTDGKGLRKVLDVENTFEMTLEPGTCVSVKTGAPIPNGATAVVQIKDAKLIEKSDESDDTYIEIMVEPQNEDNIKPVGYDLMKGKLIGIPNMHIGPLDMALLAASGRKEILVVKHISIGVLSIGNNLEEPEKPLKPGYVYDINRITLISLLKEKGYHSLDFGIVDNELVSIQNKIGEVLKKVDLLVTTGSTNDRDLLKTVLEKHFEADIHFGNVCIKPAKSTIFASCKIDDTKKYFLCLPGNPTSAFIGAQMFLVPLVNEFCCNLYPSTTIISTCMKHQYTLHSRTRLAWTILEWTHKEEFASAFSKGNAISDKLVSALGANALLLLSAKEKAKELPKSYTYTPAILVKFPRRFNEKNFCNALPEKEAQA